MMCLQIPREYMQIQMIDGQRTIDPRRLLPNFPYSCKPNSSTAEQNLCGSTARSGLGPHSRYSLEFSYPEPLYFPFLFPFPPFSPSFLCQFSCPLIGHNGRFLKRCSQPCLCPEQQYHSSLCLSAIELSESATRQTPDSPAAVDCKGVLDQQ